MPEPMPSKMRAGLDTAELLDVFLTHAGSLSAFTLARLSFCSKEFQGIVQLHIKNEADSIIPAAAREAIQENKNPTFIVSRARPPADNFAAVEKRCEMQVHYSEALQWLCQAAGEAALKAPSLGSRLVMIPEPPFFVIKALVAGGVRLSLDHLVAASKAHVPGCRMWGRSKQVYIELPPSVVDLATGVCTSDLQLSALQRLPELSPQHVLSLLYIAVNSSNPASACELRVWLLRDTARTVHISMLKYTWRKHTTAMQQLQQAVNQPTILRTLLWAAVYREHSNVLELLCQMTAVHQLSVADAFILIDSALDSYSSKDESINIPLLSTVCRRLPAAQLLPVSDITELFRKVLYTSFDYAEDLADVDRILQVLAELPAAQQVDEETATHFLRESMQMGLTFHRSLQPVQQLGVAVVRKAIYDTLEWYGHDGGVYKNLLPVLGHPAVQQLSSDDLEQLLLIALAKSDDDDVMLLCHHVVAANISPTAVGRVLAAAVQLNSSKVALRSILALPRLDAVSMEDMLPGIRAAMCSSRSTHMQDVVLGLHAKQAELGVAQALPEALRMAVLLQNRSALQRAWQLSTRLRRSAAAEHEQVAAVAVCATLGGCAAAIHQLLGLASPPNQVQVWQQLLAVALLAQEREAALPLAGECFHQQQLHEPWLPDLMRLAVAAGRAGHAEQCPAVTHVNAAAGCTANGVNVQQQQQLQTQQEQGLQQLLQLQGQELEVFSEDCLQQVASVMAAATHGTAGSVFSSSMDLGTGAGGACSSSNRTPVAAVALQLLRSKRDQNALQLLQTSLHHIAAAAAAAGAGTEQHEAAVAVVAELLQIAVAASNAAACRILCMCSISQHLSQQQVMHLLMLAVQLLHSSTPWQRQQRLHVMRCVCKLFCDRTVAAVQADIRSSSGSSMATRACVRQVLACAVQLGDEEALQQLLALIPVQEQPLLSHTDLYVLQVTALKQPRFSPCIMQMLCGLRLSWHSDEDPALQPMSANRLFDLLKQAVQLGSCKKGVSEMLQILIAWQPHPLPNTASDPGLASSLEDGTLLELVGCATWIDDVSERSLVLKQLGDLGGPNMKQNSTWKEVKYMLVPEKALGEVP